MQLVGRHLGHVPAPRAARGAESITDIDIHNYIYIYTYTSSDSIPTLQDHLPRAKALGNNPAVRTLGWFGHGLVIPCEDLVWEAACGLR